MSGARAARGSARRAATEVLVIDDHPLIGLGVDQALAAAPDLRVCAIAPDLTSALRQPHIAPELCLLDLHLGADDGLGAIAPLRRRWPGIGVLIFSVRAPGWLAAGAVELGAHGYLQKGATPRELIDALRRVRDRDREAHPLPARGASGPDNPTLTPRESEVLTLLAEGHSTSQIAQRLRITPQTVSTHKRRLLDRFGADNLIELLRSIDAMAPPR